MAFHLSNHVLLADEVDQDCGIGYSGWSLGNGQAKPLQGLWEVRPNVPPEGVTIRPSKENCAKCLEFAEWVEEIYGVKFELRDC